MSNMINQSKTGTVSIAGTVTASGQTVSVAGAGTYTETTSAATFEGVAGLRKHVDLSGSVSANGQTAPLSASTDAYYDSNYKPLGSTSAGAYCVTTAYTSLPANAPAGTSGTWISQDCYASSAKTSKIGSGTVTYTVEADSANSLILRLTTRVTDSAGNVLPSTASYRVTTTGATSRLTDAVTVTVNGASANLTISYQ
ncbi:hypothetical protein ACFPOE_19920 [Caenimonas terrae]|uniref:Uncharacterized protein n=1 Tax=Caenimonas terrae TaxID=696074 RepID=A0ABW0NJB4_9BURK